MASDQRAEDAEADVTAHDAGYVVDDIEETEAFSGIDLSDHAFTCTQRPPNTPFRWWLCPNCHRNVDLFGGNVL